MNRLAGSMCPDNNLSKCPGYLLIRRERTTVYISCILFRWLCHIETVHRNRRSHIYYTLTKMYCKFPGYSTLPSYIDDSEAEAESQWRGIKSLYILDSVARAYKISHKNWDWSDFLGAHEHLLLKLKHRRTTPSWFAVFFIKFASGARAKICSMCKNNHFKKITLLPWLLFREI